MWSNTIQSRPKAGPRHQLMRPRPRPWLFGHPEVSRPQDQDYNSAAHSLFIDCLMHTAHKNAKSFLDLAVIWLSGFMYHLGVRVHRFFPTKHFFFFPNVSSIWDTYKSENNIFMKNNVIFALSYVWEIISMNCLWMDIKSNNKVYIHFH